MASNKSVFINHMLAPSLVENKRTERYLANSGDGDIIYEQNQEAATSMQVDGAQLVDAPMSSLLGRIGVSPAGFEIPKGKISSSSNNSFSGIPIDVVAAPQPQIGSNKEMAPFKGSWTVEEDRILKEKVMQLGEQRWSVIAQSLPRRIGKQCRERWINHINPKIKHNDIWTEDDDKKLIQAHKSYGNRWSVIARDLPGWSENAIKNHWNATKRSLKAKRRLKKKKSEQVPPGQLSILEKYIRSLYPAFESTTPPPSASPAVQSLAYNRIINLGAVQTSTPSMEMQLNDASQARSPVNHLPVVPNHEKPLLPDLNISYDPQEEHYMDYPMDATLSAPQLQHVAGDPKQASCRLFSLADSLTPPNSELKDCPSYYIGDSFYDTSANNYYRQAGPSNIRAIGEPIGETSDSIDLASREFLMPSSEEVSLGLARFK